MVTDFSEQTHLFLGGDLALERIEYTQIEL